MTAGAWLRWCDRVGEAWNRHVRHRELYRQLDLVRAELTARAAWVDQLSDEEIAEMLRGLTVCIDAVLERGSDAPERTEGRS
ncbi:hypothetical protein [Streptomyces chattanoogensis]|uniref:Uncharacterized protein n=1 Tax=Streptomyces chattanoogensis TaxID=66876 RepID=A0A0N0H0Y1_9ACTN|nr:hypothetical protein [Streptomyces chattanoogensis]KPC64011.1 hypothetical protein ADL29_13265 [Streptomyces chattanoogensis]